MREFFKHPFVVLVLLITGTILAGIIFFKTCTHEVTYKGTVMSHHTASNRYGEIEYYTIVVFEDGTIRSISGLKFYVKKVGDTVHYTQTKLK